MLTWLKHKLPKKKVSVKNKRSIELVLEMIPRKEWIITENYAYFYKCSLVCT